METDSARLIWRGKEFHRMGALVLKARPPFVFSLQVLGSSRSLEEDRRVRDGAYGEIKSVMYGGVRPDLASYVVRRILKSILNEMGNQCRDARTGVMWSNFLEPVKRRAAAFWIS